MNEKKDLFKSLETFNAKNAINTAYVLKYNYPSELKALDSRDKLKRNYRKKIQKNILHYLAIAKPTKEDKNSFETFLKTFVIQFTSLQNMKVESIYNFRNDAKKVIADKVLKLYQAIK